MSILSTVIQYFHRTFWLLVGYHQAKSACKRIIGSENNSIDSHILIISVFPVTLTLKGQQHDSEPLYQVWLHKVGQFRRYHLDKAWRQRRKEGGGNMVLNTQATTSYIRVTGQRGKQRLQYPPPAPTLNLLLLGGGVGGGQRGGIRRESCEPTDSGVTTPWCTRAGCTGRSFPSRTSHSSPAQWSCTPFWPWSSLPSHPRLEHPAVNRVSKNEKVKKRSFF